MRFAFEDMIQIDRQKIYESHGYNFKNFVSLTDDEKLMILRWRNHENVRSLMVNTEVISQENHLYFIKSLEQRSDCYYWLVSDKDGAQLGVMDIIHINYKENVGEVGFYLNQEELGRGFEFMIESLYFAFAQLKLKTNLVTVDVENKDLILFNKYIGTVFEGVKKINGKSYYFSNHMTGDYLVTHYNEFNLLDYARFIKKNK